MTAADSRDMVIYGSVELKVDFGGCELPLRVMVMDMQPEVVIRMDALYRWSAIVNTQRWQLKVEDRAFLGAGRPAQQVHLVWEDDRTFTMDLRGIRQVPGADWAKDRAGLRVGRTGVSCPGGYKLRPWGSVSVQWDKNRRRDSDR